MTDFNLAVRFLERSQYYLAEEYPLKIAAALRSMPAEKLWWRPHAQANSAGNIVLHLCGNVRQWIVAGVGGAPDVRDRHAEFAATDGLSCEALVAGLYDACTAARDVLAALSPASLGEKRYIQGRETTVFAAVYHVVEHFSGHTGQIILLAKSFSPDAVRFYDDSQGLARPLFRAGNQNDID
jgi:uncharacterized damage-inducible protein DinB